MKLKLLWIGRSKEPAFVALIDQYRKRLKHYCKLEIVEVKEPKGTKQPPDQLMRLEADALLRQIEPSDFLVLLDERGQQMTSIGLSEFFQKKMNASVPQIAMVIGGAWGVAEPIRKRANFTWSLSKLTLTHDMARVLLIEQTYRALTILKGEKYHNP